jgi:hypothetical protein
MEVLLRLYDMTKAAADGSTIDRQVTEEYLASEDYKEVIRDQLALGGVTHKDRQVDDKYEKIIGPDDQIMVSNNVTHYIKKIYTTPDSDFCYAIIEILDPKNYSGQRKDNIINLIADLKSGIKLPCSVVIQALWSYENKCEKIIRIKGVDMTLNPSFSGAGIEKIFSSVIPDVPNTSTKKFSSTLRNFENCVMKTIRFSTTAEIIGTETKVYSLSDVARRYGRTSNVYLKAKTYSDKRWFTEEDFRNITKEVGAECYETVERPADYFEEYEKDFTSVSSVRDRMYFYKYPRIVLINRVLKSYKYFYNSKKDTLSERQLMWLQVLLLQDISTLIKNVIPNILKGVNLANLYGLQQFGPEIKDTGIEFSKIYRQALVAEQVLGFIPEGRYKKWKDAYFKFLNSIVKYCFGIDCTLPHNIINQF